eukprot:TRINITY_DN34221_c0_g1_i1.p1 TRINITY_DN34221_c0_g1~~TRINITY_DN34221_c0_g1_i1.p1  ORF type:complete len:178 (-),score=34.31 TRINITY_DN34221_c0_g1_i1:141-674(-)
MTRVEMEFAGKSCCLELVDASCETWLEICRAAEKLSELKSCSVFYETEEGDLCALVEDSLQDALFVAEESITTPRFQVREAVDDAVIESMSKLLLQASENCAGTAEQSDTESDSDGSLADPSMSPQQEAQLTRRSAAGSWFGCSKRSRPEHPCVTPPTVKTQWLLHRFVESMGYFWW